MAKMWSCSLSFVLSALTLGALVSHIAMQHASQPNFKVICGINGCPDEYMKIDSYRKHLRRKHPDEMSAKEIQNPDVKYFVWQCVNWRRTLFKQNCTDNSVRIKLVLQDACLHYRRTFRSLISGKNHPDFQMSWLLYNQSLQKFFCHLLRPTASREVRHGFSEDIQTCHLLACSTNK